MSGMTTTEAAAQVVVNVRARGFWPADWPDWVIALRQLPKLFEELCEATPEECVWGDAFGAAVGIMARYAKPQFKDVDFWRELPAEMEAGWVNWAAKRDELVDVLVALRVAFAAIAAHTGEEFDADAAAVAKSAADIARGTA
jgi:hypothetical protein